jgi:predicted AAA+ superfamily ATPase
MEFKTRFFRDPDQSFFLFGPKGSGKATWLKRRFKDAIFIDLLDLGVFRDYSSSPERLRHVVEAYEPGTMFVVDEIQRVPQLLDVVHLLIEQNVGWRFILTGASARKLKKTGIDLLAGRALMKTIHPFMAAELGKSFSLQNALRTGMIPLVVDSANSDEAIRSYITLYLREEVQMEGLVRNTGAFGRFLESISFSHGSIKCK